MKHPHAELLVAIAEGEQIQLCTFVSDNPNREVWLDRAPEFVLENLGKFQFRIKPAATIFCDQPFYMAGRNGKVLSYLKISTSNYSRTLCFSDAGSGDRLFFLISKAFPLSGGQHGTS